MMGVAAGTLRAVARPGSSLAWSASIAGALIVLVVFLAAAVVHEPNALRATFALLIFANLALISLRWPSAGIMAMIVFLLALPTLRRILIPAAGWTSADLLLIVGPGMGVLLLLHAFLERNSVQRDWLLTAIGVLLTLSLLGVFNPLGNGVTAGLGGLLFMAFPLLWFVIARIYCTREMVNTLLTLVFGFGVLSAVYGLAQTSIGFSTWDSAWISATDYASLNVGGEIRAFGLSTSVSEYTQVMLAALAISLARGVNGTPQYLLAMPILISAIWLASARNAVILGVVMMLCLIAIRARHAATVRTLAVGGSIAAIAAFAALGSQLESLSSSSNAFVAHQASGLANPFDSEVSTLPVHLDLFVDGIAAGFTTPLGQGPGVTNLASERLGSEEVADTEVDISNVFVSLGAFGGIIYAFVVGAILVVVARRYRRQWDVVYLAILGVLVVSVFSWLKGGHYAMSPVLWLLAGWATIPETGENEAGAP